MSCLLQPGCSWLPDLCVQKICLPGTACLRLHPCRKQGGYGVCLMHLSWSDINGKECELWSYTWNSFNLCNQEMLLGRFIESPLRNFSLVTIACLLFHKTYFGHIPGIFNHSHATKELSMSRFATYITLVSFCYSCVLSIMQFHEKTKNNKNKKHSPAACS